MPIDAHTARSLAVSYGAEHYFGPWELLWGLKTHYPASTSAEREEAGLAALTALLRDSFLVMHVTQTQFPAEAPIAAAHATGLLSSAKFWKVPSEAPEPPFFWFATSPAGESALESGHFTSL